MIVWNSFAKERELQMGTLPLYRFHNWALCLYFPQKLAKCHGVLDNVLSYSRGHNNLTSALKLAFLC